MADLPRVEKDDDDGIRYLPAIVVLLLFGVVAVAAIVLPKPRQVEKPPVVAPPKPPDPSEKTGEVETLFSDALFGFGKGTLDGLTQQGKGAIGDLAAKLKASRVTRVSVTGYADRFGSIEANQALSSARADAVRAYLVGQGVKSELIQAIGAGSSNPLSICPGATRSPKVIECLAPNRRVEVRYWTG